MTFKQATEHKGQLEEVEFRADWDFEPDEIWETLQFGVNDKKFKFEQLAPRIIHRSPGEIVVTADNLAIEAQDLAKKMKAGQIVFPNPVSALRQQLQEEIGQLKKENLRMRQVNLELKAALKELQKEIQQQKEQTK